MSSPQRTNTHARLKRMQANLQTNIPPGHTIKLPPGHVGVFFGDAVLQRMQKNMPKPANEAPVSRGREHQKLAQAYEQAGLRDLGITISDAIKDPNWKHVLENLARNAEKAA